MQFLPSLCRFEANDHIRALRLSLLFCVNPPMHRCNKFSLLIDFRRQECSTRHRWEPVYVNTRPVYPEPSPSGKGHPGTSAVIPRRIAIVLRICIGWRFMLQRSPDCRLHVFYGIFLSSYCEAVKNTLLINELCYKLVFNTEAVRFFFQFPKFRKFLIFENASNWT